MKSNTNYSSTMLSLILPNAYLSWVKMLVIVVFGTFLLTLSAKISVPFYPVPMTMQTFVVMVMGLVLGWKLASATVLLYLIEGAFGLPVFAGTPLKGVGLAYMLGPTGGYLVGFFFSAMVMGYLGEKGFDRHILLTFIAMLTGTFLIFLFGFLWLSYLIGVTKAFQFGILPFMWSEMFKIILAALVVPTCWRVLRYFRRSN